MCCVHTSVSAVQLGGTYWRAIMDFIMFYNPALFVLEKPNKQAGKPWCGQDPISHQISNFTV